jgi:hypothetical protein
MGRRYFSSRQFFITIQRHWQTSPRNNYFFRYDFDRWLNWVDHEVISHQSTCTTRKMWTQNNIKGKRALMIISNLCYIFCQFALIIRGKSPIVITISPAVHRDDSVWLRSNQKHVLTIPWRFWYRGRHEWEHGKDMRPGKIRAGYFIDLVGGHE